MPQILKDTKSHKTLKINPFLFVEFCVLVPLWQFFLE